MSAERTWQIVLGMLPPVCLIALWHGIASAGWHLRRCCRYRRRCSRASSNSCDNRVFLGHAATTLFRLFAGFAIAVVVGVVLGVAAAGNRRLEALLRPLVRVLAPVPKIALYPALVLILGFEHASKIALVVADARLSDPARDLSGAASVEPKLVWSAPGGGRLAAPNAADGGAAGGATGHSDWLSHRPRHLLQSWCSSPKCCTSTDGLGHLLIYASRSFQTVDMFVPLITISLLGLLLNAAFNALQNGC